MLEKNKIIEIWHYNNEHNISDFMFPLVWDIMFNQMFISNDTLPLIEYIVSIIENVDIKDIKGKVKLLPKDLPQHSIIDASSKSDLLITYKNGKKTIKCILEMNSSRIMVMRNSFYVFKVEMGALEIKNGKYKKAYNTIIVNLNSYNHKSEYLVETGVSRTDFGKIIDDNIKTININIDKALNKRYTYLNNQEEKWAKICRILSTCNIKVFERELSEIMSKEKAKKIVARTKELSSDDKYIRLFENGEEDNYKEIVRNTELAEAREEAREQGLEQGLEQGREQGSKNKALDIAKNLKLAGISIDIIAKSSGLSIKEIENLS